MTKTTTPRWICLACRKYATDAISPPRGLSRTIVPLQEKLGKARTRFAPSPTGYLHLGSLRTALYNYLIAKASGGEFILRIEDTDQKRTVSDAEESLFKDLEWAGIEWDEGPRIGGPYGPYRQSERIAIYREHAEQLLQTGHAYRCFCSSERLNEFAAKRTELGLPPDYDRTCAHIPKEESDDRSFRGEPHVIRLLAPSRYPTFHDLVYGVVKPRHHKKSLISLGLSLGTFEDPILIKTDGFPTYHLANVVDDHLMSITHVIRGSEWLSSTPKHLAMYEAFGWEPPKYAHVGLLLDQNKQKLSKRSESANLSILKDKFGVFPETLSNFVALLGWSHGVGNDVMSMEELVQHASMNYTRGDSIVSPEKLWFLQKRHAARYAELPLAEIQKPSQDLRILAVQPVIKLLTQLSEENPENFEYYLSLEKSKRVEYVQDIVYTAAKSLNYTTPSDTITKNKYFFVAPTAEELVKTATLLKLHGVPAEMSPEVAPDKLIRAFANFAEIPEKSWNPTDLRSWSNSIIDQGAAESLAALPLAQQSVGGPLLQKAWRRLVHHHIRWALMATMSGPDGAETMRMLGKKETVKRLEAARQILLNRM